MNETLTQSLEKDLLAVPKNLKHAVEKAKQEVFIQTEAETGEADPIKGH